MIFFSPFFIASKGLRNEAYSFKSISQVYVNDYYSACVCLRVLTVFQENIDVITYIQNVRALANVSSSNQFLFASPKVLKVTCQGGMP